MAADKKPDAKKTDDKKKPNQKKEQKFDKKEKQETKVPKGKPIQEQSNEVLVRILGYDVPGSRNIYTGLTKIKGVSWSISNAVCVKMKIPRSKKISELTKDEIKEIEVFIRKPQIAPFLMNRRNDIESGETKHYAGTDLDMKKDFDIRRMKKIKSYKGIRHTMGQPVRGQKTRSHFRKVGRNVRVKR